MCALFFMHLNTPVIVLEWWYELKGIHLSVWMGFN